MRWIWFIAALSFTTALQAHEPKDGIKFVKAWDLPLFGKVRCINALFENTTREGHDGRMSCVAFDKEGKTLLQHTVATIYELATEEQICGVPLDLRAKNIAEFKCEYLINEDPLMEFLEELTKD